MDKRTVDTCFQSFNMSSDSATSIESRKLFVFSDKLPNKASSKQPIDSDGTIRTQEVKIIEEIGSEYGSYTWPCAVVLAQYIWFHRQNIFTGKHVLELGAGTALPSILALLCANPLSITLTDKEQYLGCFEVAKKSLIINKLLDKIDLISEAHLNSKSDPEKIRKCPVHFLPVTWGEVSPKLLEMASNSPNNLTPDLPDVIIAADCFFEQTLFDDILCTVYFLLKSKADWHEKYQQKVSCAQVSKHEPMFIFAYQVRSVSWSIVEKLEYWGLKCKSIPLESFNGDSCNIAMSNMPGNHDMELFKITLKS